MKFTKLFMLLFFGVFLFASCGKDSGDDSPDPEPEPEEDCPLSAVLDRYDSNTSIGLFNVRYDDTGRISKAGLQEFEMFYDADGNLDHAILNENIGPYILYQFTYTSDGKIESFTETWGEAPDDELRYTYTPTYSGNFIDKVMAVGLFDEELDYDFDSNGNPLKWTDPTFNNYSIFTFDSTKKGLVEGLDHELAFAIGSMIRQPFLHMSNALTSEMNYDSDGTLDNESTFSDNKFTPAGFQMEANDPNGQQYVFNYDCE